VGIGIRGAEEIVPDDLGGNQAEGEAVVPVAQSKPSVRKPGLNSTGGMYRSDAVLQRVDNIIPVDVTLAKRIGWDSKSHCFVQTIGATPVVPGH
jgi:hypothetical protein